MKTKFHTFHKDYTTNINFKEIKKITQTEIKTYLFYKVKNIN